MAISTNGVVLTRLAGALYNQQLSAATYTEVLAGFNSPTALNTLANYLVSTDFASKTDLQIATTLVTNLSLTAVTGLDNWIAAQLTAAGVGNKGAKIISMLNDFSNMSTTDATYGASVVAFNSKIDAAQALSQTSGNAGGTFLIVGTTTSALSFTLTTAANNFLGGTGNDTFEAGLIDQATPANNTLTVSDVLKGGAGTDTLNITGTGTTLDALGNATVSEIEIINVRATTANTLDAANASGATQVNANMGAGTFAVTNLAAGAAVGVIGNGAVTNGAVTYGYASATTANIINVVGGTKVATTVSSSTASPTTVTINSSGASNSLGTVDVGTGTNVTSLTVNATTALTATLAADYAATAALVVTGAGAVNIGSAGTFKTVDASANTAGLTMTIDTVTTSFKGTSANDTITTDTLAAPAAGIIDAGAGTGDKLVVAAAANVATAALRGSYTNFEVLSNSAGASILASDFAGITSVESSAAAGGFTGLSAAQAANVSVTATQGAVAYALTTATGSADVLGLTLGTGLTTAAATSVTGGALTVTGFETLNLKANPGPTATSGANRISTVDSFTGATLNTINLTGTSFALGSVATSVAVNIDGSALTGDGSTTAVGVTTAGSAVAGSTITGSSFADTFTIGNEGATYNGGAGADNFSTTAAILAADGSTDLVLAGGGGSDTITITGALTLTDNHFTNVSGMEKLATAATTAVSYTGFGAGAKTAFADGLAITSGTLADGATYTVGTGLYDKAVTLTLVSSGDGATTADNIAITTGLAADTISVTAASWVGHAATGGAIAVSTGAGADTISVTIAAAAVLATGTATITGGTGADVITSVGINATDASNQIYVIGAGHSLVSAYDSITGFDMGTGALFSSTLDFASVTLTAYGATAVSGNTAAELTAAVSAAGLVTFGGTKAAALTLSEKITAVQGLVITNAGDSALFTHGTNSYVFNNNSAGDSLVELVGIAGTSLITVNATTASAIFIA
jgi:hypothetical protein